MKHRSEIQKTQQTTKLRIFNTNINLFVNTLPNGLSRPTYCLPHGEFRKRNRNGFITYKICNFNKCAYLFLTSILLQAHFNLSFILTYSSTLFLLQLLIEYIHTQQRFIQCNYNYM